MKFKIILLSLMIINFKSSLAQNEKLSCNFFLSGSFYTCYLTIINPNGLDNFVGVNGTHSGSYTDNDVKNITIYSSSNSVSTNIPSILCAKFKNLATISYNGIRIKRIGVNSFKSCSKVKRINLENNEISEIHEQAFAENFDLQFIEFSGNKMTTLPQNLLTNQTQLQSLDFCSNLISDLPENIFKNLQNLKSLSLCWNQITNLKHEWFLKLTSLQTLNLGTNNIAELPQDIFKPLTSTSNILLSNNKLKVIHCESFGVQPKLTTINLYGNAIFAFDEQFIDDTGLISIFMTDNVCISKNIYDNSQSRDAMRTDLKKCFENYQRLITRKWEIFGICRY
jgi:Leucine-rich repeat (LRR) protein